MPPELYGAGKHLLHHAGRPQTPTLAPWLPQTVQGGTTPAHTLRLQGLTASCPPHELSAHLDETNHREINRDDEGHRYRQQKLLARAVLCFPLGQKERKSGRERLLLLPFPLPRRITSSNTPHLPYLPCEFPACCTSLGHAGGDVPLQETPARARGGSLPSWPLAEQLYEQPCL